MPLYSFECNKGHVFEKIVPYSEISKKIPCIQKPCRAKAKQVWLSYNIRRKAQNFQPTRLFVNAQGQTIVPGHNNLAELPKSYLNKLKKEGYSPVEITNFRQYESFRRDINDKLKAQATEYNYKEQRGYNEMLQAQIGSLVRGESIEIPDGQGGMKSVNMRLSDMSPKGRALAERAIKEAQDFQFKSEDPNFFGNAFENDNISYRDEESGWKKRY